MSGYDRQSSFTTDDTILASDHNNEYNALVAAFDEETGHAHDGTATEGPVIGLIGDPGLTTPKNKVVVDTDNNAVGVWINVSGTSTQQAKFTDGAFVPVTDDDIDLGSASSQFKNGYFDGTVTTDALEVGSGTTVTTILDEDDMSSDSDTALATQQSIKAYVDSVAAGQDTLAEVLSAGNSTGGTNIVVTSGDVITTDTINETTSGSGVTIDSLLVKDGGFTAAGACTFSGQTISNLGTVTTADINGGTIDGTNIGASSAGTGNFSTLSISGTAITSTAAELNYVDGVTSNIQTQLDAKAPIASPTFTGTTTIPTADINGGAIDGTVIGASSAAAGTFTTLADQRGSIASQINPLAKAVRVAMTAASSGSNGIKVLNNVNLNLGESGFTLVWKGSLPSWPPSTLVRAVYKVQDSSNRFGLNILTDGTLSFFSNSTATGTYIQGTSTAAHGLSDGEVALIAVSVVRETALASGAITFFVNGIQLGSPIAIAAAEPLSIQNSGALYCSAVNTLADGRAACDFLESMIYNRALSAAEVLDLSINGPALADIGASQTNLLANLNGNFETWISPTNLGTWSEGGSVSASIYQESASPISGTYSLGFVGSGTPTSSFNNTIYRDYFSSSDVGKRFRAKIKAKRISGSGGMYIGQGGGQELTISSSEFTTGAVVEIVREWTISTASSNAGHVVIAAPSGTEFVVDDYEIYQIGLTGHWSAEDCQGDTGQVFDSSGNKNHALLPAAGATRIPAVREFEVRWTNTWAGTHEAQYIGGTNQATLNANACITSIVGKVSGASSQNIIVGDGSDDDRFVASVGLVDGVQVFTIANATTDGTNQKLVANPDANFTGSIIWTIKGYILEA